MPVIKYTSTPCRAKIKSQCPYHGAEIRLNDALAKLASFRPDVEEYRVAFEEAAKAKADMDAALKAKGGNVWNEPEPQVAPVKPQIKSLKPGQQLILTFKNASNKVISEEEATFVSYAKNGDEQTATFSQVNPTTGKTYEWDAYRFQNRWVYGSSAEPLSIKELVDTPAKPIVPKLDGPVSTLVPLDTANLDTAAPTLPKYHGVFDADSAEVQRGEVVDAVRVVDENGYAQNYYRYYDNPADPKNSFFPAEPYEIRIQANRKLSDDDVEKMASQLGYAYRVSIVGESLGTPWRDSPYSFIVSADTTKSRRDDLGMALEDLHTKFPLFVKEGTPQRKTQDMTRAIDGFNEDNLKVQFYYDSVYDGGNNRLAYDTNF